MTRARAAALLLAALALGASAQTAPEAVAPPRRSLSKTLQAALLRAEGELAATEIGRRVLAESSEVPVLEQARSGLGPLRYRNDAPAALVADAELAARLSPVDLEISLLRERQRALARCPIPLIEDELSARQAVLEYVLEKALASPPFAKLLREAYLEAERFLLAREKIAQAARRSGKPIPPWRPPSDALQLAARHLYLFSEDPYAFYAVVEDAVTEPEAVRLGEIEDFIEHHGAELDAPKWRAGGRYCLAGDRLYPGRVVRAALVVRDREGLARLREGLGPFQTVLREQLRTRVNRWIREGR